MTKELTKICHSRCNVDGSHREKWAEHALFSVIVLCSVSSAVWFAGVGCPYGILAVSDVPQQFLLPVRIFGGGGETAS